MTQPSDLNILIKSHLNLNDFNDKAIVKDAAMAFVMLVDDYVDTTSGETFYTLPYKDITVLVFDDDAKIIKTDAYVGFTTTVKEEILEICSGENPTNVSIEHIVACYEKFISHIELALIQKNFMLKSAKKAESLAKDADHISKEASKQAQNAQELSSNMITNFVTILGIFATIIITVFSGINLVGSTVKLLEGSARLSYLVFVVSFLMVCFLTLIQMLTLWINKLNGKDENITEVVGGNNTRDDTKKVGLYKQWLKFPLYTKAIQVLGILILLSLICISCLPQKEKSDDESSKKDYFRNATTTGININIDSKGKNNIPTSEFNTMEQISQEVLDEDIKK